MSLKSIRDSILSRFLPQPKPEAVDPVPLPAEEQQQIEVQEMNTGMVRNNYLMRNYLMSLPEEERQKYIDAQNANPAIKGYKEGIGLEKYYDNPNGDPSALNPKPNEEYCPRPDESSIIGVKKPGSLLRNK